MDNHAISRLPILTSCHRITNDTSSRLQIHKSA